MSTTTSGPKRRISVACCSRYRRSPRMGWTDDGSSARVWPLWKTATLLPSSTNRRTKGGPMKLVPPMIITFIPSPPARSHCHVPPSILHHVRRDSDCWSTSTRPRRRNHFLAWPRNARYDGRIALSIELQVCEVVGYESLSLPVCHGSRQTLAIRPCHAALLVCHGLVGAGADG